MYVRVVIIFALVCLMLDKFCSSHGTIRFNLARTPTREALCGTSEPNKTITVKDLRVRCLASCTRKGFDCSQYISPFICVAFNYWAETKVCEHFYYEPTKSVNPGCELFQVAFYYLRSTLTL